MIQAQKSGPALDALPRRGVSFVRDMGQHSRGYCVVAALTYCLNEGYAFPTAALALKVYFMDYMGLDGSTSARFSLPMRFGWIIKPLVGVMSDVLPIFGYRRCSYMGISILLGLIGWACLSFLELPLAATMPFIAMAGLSLAVPDIMVDATAAELVKKIPTQASNLQTMNFTAFSLGGLLACASSGLLVQRLGPYAAFAALSAILVCLLITVFLRLLPETRVPREARGLDTAWLQEHAGLATLCAALSISAGLLIMGQVFIRQPALRGALALGYVAMALLAFRVILMRVSRTLANLACFVFLHACLQPSYPDTMFRWMRRAQDGPHFSVVVLSWTDCFGAVGLFMGVAIYHRFLTTKSYRSIFTFAIACTALPSLMDLAMVKRWNLAVGVPDALLAIGDETFQHCIMRLFRMPVAVLATKVCPAGLEGSVMSLVLSLGGIGGAIGVLWGSCALEELGVTQNDYSSLPCALMLRGICRLLPLLLLPIFIPKNLAPHDSLEAVEAVEEAAAMGKVVASGKVEGGGKVVGAGKIMDAGQA